MGLLFTDAKAAVGILFGAVSMLVTTILSMVNVACFYYEHRGTPMNFGFARALGSLAYAVLSVILGKLIEPCGIKVVVIAGIMIFAAEILLVLSMPYEGQTTGTPDQKSDRTAPDTAEKKRAGFGVFFRRYPAFILMVAACTLFLTFHDMYTNYLLLIMEKVGGGNHSRIYLLKLFGRIFTANTCAFLVELVRKGGEGKHIRNEKGGCGGKA